MDSGIAANWGLKMKGHIAFCLVVAAQYGLLAAPSNAYAQHAPPPHGCIDLTKMKSLADADDAKWIDLTQDQWQFARTLSYILPGTPEGFPYGDKAALARNGNRSMLIFIDGARACDMMPVSQSIVDALNDVGDIRHEPAPPVQGQDQ